MRRNARSTARARPPGRDRDARPRSRGWLGQSRSRSHWFFDDEPTGRRRPVRLWFLVEHVCGLLGSATEVGTAAPGSLVNDAPAGAEETSAWGITATVASGGEARHPRRKGASVIEVGRTRSTSFPVKHICGLVRSIGRAVSSSSAGGGKRALCRLAFRATRGVRAVACVVFRNAASCARSGILVIAPCEPTSSRKAICAASPLSMHWSLTPMSPRRAGDDAAPRRRPKSP